MVDLSTMGLIILFVGIEVVCLNGDCSIEKVSRFGYRSMLVCLISLNIEKVNT